MKNLSVKKEIKLNTFIRLLDTKKQIYDKKEIDNKYKKYLNVLKKKQRIQIISSSQR